MNEQSRINATIAYFFLGPLFLLVRGDTPFGEPFVRGHARRATIIIASSIVILGLYIFLISPLIRLSIFGVSIHSIILALMMAVLSLLLLHGAYRAYHGIDAVTTREWFTRSTLETERIIGNYTDEEKIRILASFIPFVGIFIAAKNPKEPYITGRKVGSLFAGTLIAITIYFGSSGSTLGFFILIMSIVLFIITAVLLFLQGQFLHLSAYKFIPSYSDLEAYIIAGGETVYDFFRVAFGGTRSTSFNERLRERKNTLSHIITPVHQYPLPIWIIAIPGLNLLTLPSLWKNELSEYRHAVLQGLGITLMLAFIIWQYGWNSSIALVVLFPMSTLIAELKANTNVRAPIVSMMTLLSSLWERSRTKVATLKEAQETVNFRYTDQQEPQKTPQ